MSKTNLGFNNKNFDEESSDDSITGMENPEEPLFYMFPESSDEEDGKKEEKDDETDERYVSVYQVTFPTVAFDDRGMVKSDSDGNLIEVSIEEKNKMKDMEIVKLYTIDINTAFHHKKTLLENVNKEQAQQKP